MSVARDELTATALNDGKRAESVVLQFEDPLRVVKGNRSSRHRHRRMPSVGRIADRMAKVGRTRVVVSENPTASGFCLCPAPHCGRVLECHSPHAAMSAGFHFPFSRLSIQEALLSVRLQLLFSASTLQALSASELRKRPSWASTFKSKITTQNSRCSSDESSQPEKLVVS